MKKRVQLYDMSERWSGESVGIRGGRTKTPWENDKRTNQRKVTRMRVLQKMSTEKICDAFLNANMNVQECVNRL